jgi:hypothetical protein
MVPWLAPAAVPVRELEFGRFGQPRVDQSASVVDSLTGKRG